MSFFAQYPQTRTRYWVVLKNGVCSTKRLEADAYSEIHHFETFRRATRRELVDASHLEPPTALSDGKVWQKKTSPCSA
jgi:hypothetical protein